MSEICFGTLSIRNDIIFACWSAKYFIAFFNLGLKTLYKFSSQEIRMKVRQKYFYGKKFLQSYEMKMIVDFKPVYMIAKIFQEPKNN